MVKWSECSHFINVSYDMVYVHTWPKVTISLHSHTSVLRILCALVCNEDMVTVGQFEEKGRILPTILHSIMLKAYSLLRYECTYVCEFTQPILLFFSLLYCLRGVLILYLVYNLATLLHTGHLIMYNFILVVY